MGPPPTKDQLMREAGALRMRLTQDQVTLAVTVAAAPVTPTSLMATTFTV